MSERFRTKKREILESLSKPSDDYIDASPKGTVDDGVRDLIGQINDTPGFITTSSCAGRIAVYLEGPPKPWTSQARQIEHNETTAIVSESKVASSASGKGGGKWLFTSHSPIDLSHATAPGVLFRLFGFSSQADVSYPAAESRCQFVHFKFEPMILHILASSAEDAQAALQAAMQSGLRESGISGILDSKGQPSTPMVAVRSSGLALDSIIGFVDSQESTSGTATVQPMVTEYYLRTLVKVANERFATNEQRKVRFADALDLQRPARVSGRLSGRHGIESRAVRKERKRAEGLARKQEMLLIGGALDGAQQDAEENENGTDGERDYDLTLLMEGENDAERTLETAQSAP